MDRTTVMLPHRLKEAAHRLARERGSSLGELIREALGAHVAAAAETDPFWADRAVWQGDGPRDLAAEHDRYLYDD
jgi:hypothetical protein